MSIQTKRAIVLSILSYPPFDSQFILRISKYGIPFLSLNGDSFLHNWQTPFTLRFAYSHTYLSRTNDFICT